MAISIWLLWLWAILFQRTLISVPTALADFLAATGLFHMSRDFHLYLQRPIRGMGIGVTALGVGDLLLASQNHVSYFPSWLSEAFSLAGAVVLVLYGFSVPLGLYRLGLYHRHQVDQAILIPLVAGLSCTALVGWVNPWINSFAPLYTCAAFALMFLFGLEALEMNQGRLKRSLQAVMGALVLVCVARVASAVGGPEPSILVSNLYGLLWIAGMNLVALSVADSEAGRAGGKPHQRICPLSKGPKSPRKANTIFGFSRDKNPCNPR